MCLDLQSGLRYLLVVGLLPGGSSPHFVVISTASQLSQDYFVNDLSAASLNAAFPVIFFDEKGAPLSEKWPLFNQTLMTYRFKADQLITMQFKGENGQTRQCLYMPNPRKGIAYDIDSNELINMTGTKTVNGTWISSTEEMTFYGLDSVDQSMAKYTFTKEGSEDRYRINQASSFYYFCKASQNSSEKVTFEPTSCSGNNLQPVGWTILNGFADKTSMYLFEATQVHIFPLSSLESTLKSPASTSPKTVTVASYSLLTFINCPGQPVPTTTTTALPSSGTASGGGVNASVTGITGGYIITSTPPSTFLIALGVVLLLVIFIFPTALAFIVLFCCKGPSAKAPTGLPPPITQQAQTAQQSASQSSSVQGPAKKTSYSQGKRQKLVDGGGSSYSARGSKSSKRTKKKTGGGSSNFRQKTNVSMASNKSKSSKKKRAKKQSGRKAGAGKGKGTASVSQTSTLSKASKQTKKTSFSKSSKKRKSTKKKKSKSKNRRTSSYKKTTSIKKKM